MSIIIGYVSDGKVYMGADSAKTLDNYSFSDTTETGMNVFRLPGGVICGVIGTAVKQTIQTNPQWFDGLADEPLTKKFIVNEVLPELFGKLKELDLLDGEEGEDPDLGGTVLLAQNDKLFCIDSDFCVYAVDEFCVAGNGSDYTVPRIMLHKDEPIGDMMYAALTDAKAYMRNVCEPYYMLSTVAEFDEKQLPRKC